MSFVTYEPQGAVAYLIINRPEALNALNSQVPAILIPFAASSCAARARSPSLRARISRR